MRLLDERNDTRRQSGDVLRVGGLALDLDSDHDLGS